VSVEGVVRMDLSGRREVRYIDRTGGNSHLFPPQDAEVEVLSPEEPKGLYAVVSVNGSLFVRARGTTDVWPWDQAGNTDDEPLRWSEIEKRAQRAGVAIKVQHAGVAD
jgi:hypothetical protein